MRAVSPTEVEAGARALAQWQRSSHVPDQMDREQVTAVLSAVAEARFMHTHHDEDVYHSRCPACRQKDVPCSKGCGTVISPDDLVAALDPLGPWQAGHVVCPPGTFPPIEREQQQTMPHLHVDALGWAVLIVLAFILGAVLL